MPHTPYFRNALILSSNLLRDDVGNRKTMALQKGEAGSLMWFRGTKSIPESDSSPDGIWDLTKGPIIACSTGIKHNGCLHEFRSPSGLWEMKVSEFLNIDVAFERTQAAAKFWQLAPSGYAYCGDDGAPWASVLCICDANHYERLNRKLAARMLAESRFDGIDNLRREPGTHDRQINIEPRDASSTDTFCFLARSHLQKTRTFADQMLKDKITKKKFAPLITVS